MTPAARLQASIDILSGLTQSALPADRFIREFFRARRYAGSKDRAAVAERVFNVLRHRASLAWRMGGDDPRRLVIASVLADGEDVAALFTGAGYAPAALDEGEARALAAPPGEMPDHVRAEVPEFLVPELERAFGANWPVEMEAMLARASIDIRTNTLKTSREALQARLGEEGFTLEPTPYAPQGLRMPFGPGAAALGRSTAFTEGLFEFQDEAAQIASALANAAPGARVLDLAAGAGGKALAMAADMRNDGTIIASDISDARLLQIGPRATRAGVTIIEARAPNALGGGGTFDCVLVDAPCSGSGTWRRQPEAKWRLTPQLLSARRTAQDQLLEKAATHVRPGGRIVYATCSVLRCENDDRITAFLSAHPDFTLAPIAANWPAPAALPGDAQTFRASPHRAQMDGFFTALLVRRG